MLRSMRDGAKSGITKFILFGFLVLAVFGLVLTDVGGFFRGGVAPTAVAEINGEEIPVRSFENIVRRVLSQNGIDVATAYQMGLINQILQSEISNNLLQYAAHDMGIRISDEEIARQLGEFIAPMVSEDVTPEQALSMMLRQQGMSEAQMVQTLRAEMSSNMLRSGLLIPAGRPSLTESKYRYMYENETRTVSYIFFPDSRINDIPPSSDEVLLPLYQAGKERYAIPETRKITLAVIDQSALEESYEVSDEELRAIYERDIDTYRENEKRLLAQAIFSDAQTAQKVADALKSNQAGDLKEAVLSVTGDETAFTGEQSFEQAGLPEELADPVFKAATGTTLGPIETMLGHHVVVVKSVIAPYTRPFEDVKTGLSQDIRQMRLADQMFEMANLIDDQLAGGLSIENIQESTPLKTFTFGPMRADGTTTDNKEAIAGDEWNDDRVAILETAFAALANETSPVFELGDGRYAFVRIEEIKEKSYKPFEDVKTEIDKTWIEDQKIIANRQRVMDDLRKINAGEASLADLGSVQKATLSRTQMPQAPWIDNGRNIFMNAMEGDTVIAPAQNGMVIGTIDKINLPEADQAAQEAISALAEQRSSNMRAEVISAYLAYLSDKYNVKVNETALRMSFGPGGEEF